MASATTDADPSVLAEDAIRGALSRGDSKAALNAALRFFQASAADERKHRPEWPLADAELAGTILSIGLTAAAYQPERPAGSPRKPRPHDLLTVFQQALDKGAGEGR